MTAKIDRNMELRKLPAETLSPVVDILSEDDSWERLMRNIPENPEDLASRLRYGDKHVSIIRKEASDDARRSAKMLFDEWGCTGRVRPTLATLQRLLIGINLYRAADEVSRILKEPLPPRPTHGPAAPVPLEVTDILNGDSICQQSTAQMLENQESSGGQKHETIPVHQNIFPYAAAPVPDLEFLRPKSDMMQGENQTFNSRASFKIHTEILKNTNLVHFEYEYLSIITKKFTNHIGNGGFGDVFYGYDDKRGYLAIKKSRENFNNKEYNAIFNREVRSLAMLKHENIVPILGISINGPACIVCEYVEGGSLMKKISQKVLTEHDRLKIIAGVCEGLRYIHNCVIPHLSNEMLNKRYYFIHGDVKSDNILLTKDLVPKLCDFGLSKQITSSDIFTESPKGTSVYMAPETFEGTITQKSDVYSFGVVLLEILTGLKPVTYAHDGRIGIRLYIKKNGINGDISHLLDSTVIWTKAKEIFEISKLCLNVDKDLRPSMEDICGILKSIKITER